MNIVATIILLTLVADLILNTTADILNLKVLQRDVPAEFNDIYDGDSYKKSQDYLQVNTRFGWVVSIFSLIIVLVFWFGEGFNMLDQWVRSLGWGPVATGLIYIGILAFVKALLAIPFSIYGTFVIEERFGFNKTTWATFLIDMLKGAILALVIGVPLLAGVLAFFEYAGAYAWVYCWVAVTLFMLVVQFIAPTWILPLFNKYVPLEEGDLRSGIMAYARSIQFPLQNLFVMDGSRRSSKSNAFFTGFGKNKRIVLFDTLIKQHTVQELVAVLAHEMGHYKKKHILKNLVVGIFQTGFMLFLLSIFISFRVLFDAFYVDEMSVYAGLLFFAMLYTPLEFFIGLLMQMVSRRNENEADRFAVETTGDGRSMVNALKKLSVNNLSNLLPHPLYVILNYSHPPVLERIKFIRSINQ